MKVFAVVGYEWLEAEAVYANLGDAERHVEYVPGDDHEVQEWDVWPEFSTERFTKKRRLRAGVYEES